VVLGWLMTVEVVVLLAFGVSACASGSLFGPVLLALAVTVGWITHPIRWAIDGRYRRTTTRPWWG
jgi:hypothetical protein